MSDLKGKTAVIVSVAVPISNSVTKEHTSFSTHIGRACARDLALQGMHIFAIDENEEALAAVESEVLENGGTFSKFIGDSVNPMSLRRAAEACAAEGREVRVLVNCHFDVELASIEHSTDQSWERVMRFNLLGPVYASREFLPLLKRTAGAAIVHVGSIDGILGNPQIPHYSAARGALIPLTHVMAEEFAQYDIRVNCVARGMMTEPGGIMPPMSLPLIAQTPIARPAYPQEVANAVRYLISEEASYVNGVVLPVDGGRSGITQGCRPRR